LLVAIEPLKVRRQFAMRQIGDLLVWVVLIIVLAGVVYFSPQLGRYVSGEGKPAYQVDEKHSLALNLTPSSDDSP
jgi:hypothetical protein